MVGHTPPNMALWDGRVDADGPREALRWHQVVAPLDLATRSSDGRRGCCFIGYRCDDGIARNLGRPSAAAGPARLRRRLSNLPVGFSAGFELLDAGDVVCEESPVERAQEALAAVGERVKGRGLFPAVLGGGHDLTSGHWLGASLVRAA